MLAHELPSTHRTSHWTIVGAEDAGRILDTEQFDRQRRVRKDHVILLSRLMLSGDFQPSEIKFAVTPDGRRYLINGQHRLLAIIMCRRPQTLLVTMVPASDMFQVSILYSAEDRGLARTISDTYGALDIAARIGLPPHFVRRAGAAMHLIDGGFAGRVPGYRLLDSERVELLDFYAPQLREWGNILGLTGAGPKTGRHAKLGSLNKAPVISVGLVTLRYQPEAARSFWKAAADNDGLRKGQPARTLVDFVSFNKLFSAGSLVYSNAKAVARCWNAHFEGRDLAFARTGNPSDPILILGTPYDGKAIRTHRSLMS